MYKCDKFIKTKRIVAFLLFVVVIYEWNQKYRKELSGKVILNITLASKISENPHKIYNVTDCGCQRTYFYPPLEKYKRMLNSSCSDEGTLFQSNQKVVSFSLHIPNTTALERGQKQYLYIEGIRLNLDQMRRLYQGHSMRVYTDESLTEGGDYCQLICNSSDLFWCDVKSSPSLGNQIETFFPIWRFFPLGDPTVDYFLSRDLDSVITQREVAAIQDWLKFDKSIHVMRDHMHHGLPMAAGMWGARNGLLKGAAELRTKIIKLSGGRTHTKGLDQEVITNVIFYPRKDDIVAYDSYYCKRFSVTMMRPFPTQRKNAINDFVGNVDLGRAKYNLSACPIECRPDYGKGWKYC